MPSKPLPRVEVTEKRCRRCEETKPAEQFRANSRMVDGLLSYCRQCSNAMRRECRAANPDRERRAAVERYEKNKDLINAQGRASYERNRARRLDESRRWREANPERFKRGYTQWRAANQERLREVNKAWVLANPEKVKAASRRKYERKKQDPSWRLRRVIQAGMWKALKGIKGHGRWFDLLDYSVEELRSHLERQFTKGMSWENMGEWHIDHIIPMASFTIYGPYDPELKRAWALPNLRPLWGTDNMSKGAKVVSLL